MADKVPCGKCGGLVDTSIGETHCSFCGSPLVAAPALDPLPAATPNAVGTRPSAEIFSERMRANKAIAGRTCNGCMLPIELGDDVWNCQVCGESMHANCHEQQKGCGNLNCSAHIEAFKPAPSKVGPPGAIAAPAGPSTDYVDCTSCGEKILKKATKCRFCGELQGSAARAKQARLSREAEADDNLTGFEIAVGILCGTIACIMSIIWIIQGKKKGWKLLLISIVSSIIMQLISAAAKR